MTTDLRDLRTDIDYDKDFPFVVLDAHTDRLRARFASEEHAIDWAAGHNAYVVDSTPARPPVDPGWYESGRQPIDKQYAGNQPYHLDELGIWTHYTAEAGMSTLTYDQVAAAMPLRKIGVLA
jgi:hypothetical protein